MDKSGPSVMTDDRLSPLEAWSIRLSAEGTPVFSRTVREVSSVSADEEASARDLSAVVSQDASMTARLLRIANSAIFNPQHRPVETMSAAVIMLVFDVVQELALSLALIEKVLSGNAHTRVTQGLARAFHAAAQAKSFAVLRRDRCPEEVFVAALLYQIGDMAFWSTDADERAAVEALVAKGVSFEVAERRVLGFSLSELSRRLAVDWSLGDLVKETLDGKVDVSSRSSHIALGHQIAKVIEVHGKDSAEVLSVMRRLAAHLNVPVERVESRVSDNLEAALKIARSYGITSLDTALPLAEPELRVEAAETNSEALSPADIPAAERLLNLLGRLSTPVEAGAPLDALMRYAVSVVHDGTGFDRTYFALLSPDRKSMQAKYILGDGPPGFEGSRRALEARHDFFQLVFESGKAAVYDNSDQDAVAANLGWFCAGECVCIPIVVSSKPIGILYADRSSARQPVDEPTLVLFQLAGMQIPMILSQARKAG
ncbi:MAG: HDOD domain-containing protein [Gammaproteobacteria bacterium]|nr:HDOD domain-containing protein [Gammaproteobacteria bacterium]